MHFKTLSEDYVLEIQEFNGEQLLVYFVNDIIVHVNRKFIIFCGADLT